MKIKNLIVIALSIIFIASAFAQEKPNSYWVTTDAGEKMEVFQDNTTQNPNGSRSSGSISTLFATNNGGSPGGAVYFDIVVGSSNVFITAFDVNTPQTGTMTMDVYTSVGGVAGNENNAAAWGSSAATGAGTGAGQDLPSNLRLNQPIELSANTTYGIALVMDAFNGHSYTNGTGINESYSDSFISLSLGSATNYPFVGTVFHPRVWNGTIYYIEILPVPLSNWALGIGLLFISGFIVVRFRRRLA